MDHEQRDMLIAKYGGLVRGLDAGFIFYERDARVEVNGNPPAHGSQTLEASTLAGQGKQDRAGDPTSERTGIVATTWRGTRADPCSGLDIEGGQICIHEARSICQGEHEIVISSERPLRGREEVLDQRRVHRAWLAAVVTSRGSNLCTDIVADRASRHRVEVDGYALTAREYRLRTLRA